MPAFPGMPEDSTGKGLQSDSGATEWDTYYLSQLLEGDFVGIK